VDLSYTTDLLYMYDSAIKMEVGIEDCLHIEFEKNKSLHYFLYFAFIITSFSCSYLSVYLLYTADLLSCCIYDSAIKVKVGIEDIEFE